MCKIGTNFVRAHVLSFVTQHGYSLPLDQVISFFVIDNMNLSNTSICILVHNDKLMCVVTIKPSF